MSELKRMKARYAGRCWECDEFAEQGSEIFYDPNRKKIAHVHCIRKDENEEAEPLSLSSTHRKAFESNDKKTWLTGAAGERRVKEGLEALVSERLLVLHDLTIPGAKANLDHLALTPAGVYLIDAKHYAGKKIDFTVEGALQHNAVKYTPGTPSSWKYLTVDGKPMDGSMEPFHWELEQVRAALPEEVPVYRILCFVNGLWEKTGFFGGAKWVNHGWFALNGNVEVCSPDKLQERISLEGPPEVQLHGLRDFLLDKFPQA